jgi:hypothetical protein
MATAVEQIEPVKPVITGSISFAELVRSPQYKRLTPSQKFWFIAYLASGDEVFAARLAFHCRSELNTRNLARQTSKSPRVRAAINLYCGKSEREIFLEELERTIRASADGSVAKVRAMSLYAKLKFDIADEPEAKDASKNPPEPTPKFSVGDVVVQRGVRFRATKVSVEGKVLEAEEIA